MKHQGPVHGVDRPCRGLSASRGFTVIELMMVLAILGVLAAIATPRIARSLAQNRALQAAALIKSDIRRVASQARATSQPWTITFSSTGYTIAGNNATGAAVSSTVTLTDEPYLASIASISCGADNALVFTGHGSCAETGRLRVRSGSAVCEVVSSPGEAEPVLSLQ